MSDSIYRAAFTISVMLVVANLFLFVGGFVTVTEVPTISRILTGVELNDFQSENFQQSLLLKNSEGEVLGAGTDDSFAVTILDFLEQQPLVGPIITFLRIIYELLFTMAFAGVVIAGKIGLPGELQLIIGGVLFLFYVIALYGVLRDYKASGAGNS